MDNINLTEAMLQAEINQAREAGKIADSQEPRAQSVYYDSKEKQIVITLTNGNIFLFSPDLVEGLANASEEDLKDIEITPSKEGLHWDKLDVDLSISALLMGIVGTKRWMEQSRYKRIVMNIDEY